MLSSNSSLQNGRYRVIGLFGEADGGRLYDAFDEQLGQKVVVHASSANDSTNDRLLELKTRRIKGIAQIRDGFVDGINAYLVTEPLEGRASADEFMNDPANSIGMLLSGIRSLLENSSNSGFVEINPQMIRRAQDGNNCLLHFGSGSVPAAQQNHKLTPFSALESVWPGLDMATQKAISNSCDEESMASIESQADERTTVYSLGASLYQILAGKSPLDVLVRSIELLDEKGDPLKKLSGLRPSIDAELSNVVMRMMALKRNERPSLSVALALVASLKAKQVAAIELDLDDEIDLLEIPFETNSKPEPIEATHALVSNVSQALPEMPAMIASMEEKVELADTADKTPLAVDTEEEKVTPMIEPITTSVSMPTRSDVDVPTFAAEPASNGSGNGVKIAAAAAGLLIVAVTGWFVLGSGSGTSASASTATPERKTEPAASIAETPVATNNATAEPAVTQPAPTSTLPAEPEPNVDATKQPKRPVVAEVKPQAKPTPAKTEKPKKAMTVDDLLKDN